jgi:hypothetical protein
MINLPNIVFLSKRSCEEIIWMPVQPTLLDNRLSIPTLFPDTGGAWCVYIKLACWRALCGNFKNIFSGKMRQFPLNYITAIGLRGIKLACWRALCGKKLLEKGANFPKTMSQLHKKNWLSG